MQSFTQAKEDQIPSASNSVGSPDGLKQDVDKVMKDASDDLTQFQNLSLGPTTSASGELGLAKNSSIEDTTNLGQILDSQMMNTVNGD